MEEGMSEIGFPDSQDTGILSELGHSAAFGGVMDRDEALKWSWSENRDGKISASLDRLLGNGSIMEKEGFLTLAGMEHLFLEGAERRTAARKGLLLGLSFIEKLRDLCPELLLGGVSGSVSYGSSATGDDVDIIMITENGTLWKVLKCALLEARRIRRARPDLPILCLSYCMDAGPFSEEALNHRSRLFARDFLRMKTGVGRAFYVRTLKECSWMRDFYPAVYDERLNDAPVLEDKGDIRPRRTWNGITYITLGSYLMLAAHVRNSRFRRQGNEHSAFKAVIAGDRCIYVSDKWKSLEESLTI